MKENVEVRVRFRPSPATNDDLAKVGSRCVNAKKRQFEFDHVYGPESSQEEVYETAVAPLVQGVLRGFNGTVLAYGQTGSGKTHTMGTDGINEGMVQLASKELFSKQNDCSVSASCVEVYNEELRDLLCDERRKLFVRERSDGTVFVEGAREILVGSAEEMEEVLKSCARRRATEGTLCNATSSRSHAVLTMTVERSVGNELVRRSKLHCVDLAGSERSKKAGTDGMRFKEGVSINNGLLALGKVISALCDDDHQHVPYRESKLTRLLQDSLGGRSRTVMIACVNAENFAESATTIAYASRARRIRNTVTQNAAISLSSPPPSSSSSTTSSRGKENDSAGGVHVERAEAAEAAFAALLAEKAKSRSIEKEIAEKEACVRELVASDEVAKAAVEKYKIRIRELEREKCVLRERVRDGLALGEVDESQQLDAVSRLGDCSVELDKLRRQQSELAQVEELRLRSNRKLSALKDQIRLLKREVNQSEEEAPELLEKKATRWLKKKVDQIINSQSSYDALASFEGDLGSLAPHRQRAVLLEACRQVVALSIARSEDQSALAVAKDRLRQRRQGDDAKQEYQDKIDYLLRELKRREGSSSNPYE